jgi:ABC-2 type transport system permease protein
MMRGYRVFVWKELREAWATRRLLVVGVVFLLVGLGSPVLAKDLPDLVKGSAGNVRVIVPTPTTKDAIDQLLKNLGTFGPFAAILLAMGAIAGEKERGTAALALTKPLTRTAFLTAKLTGLLFTLSVGIVLAGLGAYTYTAALFTAPSVGGFVACCALALLAISVYGAFTLLGSTLVRSALPAAGIGLGVLVALGIVSAIPNLARFTPSGLTTPAETLALGRLPPDVGTPLVANLCLIVVALALSWAIFQRQELGG